MVQHLRGCASLYPIFQAARRGTIEHVRRPESLRPVRSAMGARCLRHRRDGQYFRPARASIVEHGKQVLVNLMHRGAAGADESTGDGAGILMQIPHDSLRRRPTGWVRPARARRTAWRWCSCPRTPRLRRQCEEFLAKRSPKEALRVLGWRDVPSDNRCWATSPAAPSRWSARFSSAATGRKTRTWSGGCSWSASAPSARASSSARRPTDFYVVSMSCRTICYKGMFMAPQLFAYYPDLADARIDTALAMVHQRYSTNTFPSWRLAQPFRIIAHNGEINTLRGNRNRMHAYEKSMACPALGADLSDLFPGPRAGRQRLGVLRQLHGAAGARRAGVAARADDDDSRGLRAELSHLARTSGRSTNITRRSWSPGTARRRWSSPTAGWWAARWTATACGPAATW